MLVSHQYKFVYIHVPRTAGTSIEKALKSYSDRISENSNSTVYFSHISSAKLKNHMEKDGQEWKNYFSFGFVRNPWERMVSYYLFFRKWEWFKEAWGTPSFFEWVSKGPLNKERIQELYPNHVSTIIPESAFDLLFDSNGSQIVNYIGRYETLEQDFNFLCKRINLPTKPILPHINSHKKDFSLI